jgi:hypothetical protein
MRSDTLPMQLHTQRSRWFVVLTLATGACGSGQAAGVSNVIAGAYDVDLVAIQIGASGTGMADGEAQFN